MSDPLATYLHDHQAGSRIAVDLLGAIRDQYEGEELGHFASDLLPEVEKDRELLKELVSRVGSPRLSFIKETGGWLGEKGMRVKLGSPTHDLGTLEALEALALGIQGKLALWLALEEIAPADARFSDLDFGRLKDRARSQHARIEERRLEAARALRRDEAPQGSAAQGAL